MTEPTLRAVLDDFAHRHVKYVNSERCSTCGMPYPCDVIRLVVIVSKTVKP